MTGDPLDEKLNAKRRRAANLKRRQAALRQHRHARLPDGRSAVALKGGLIGGRRRAEGHPGGPRGLGLELAMRRWHPELFTENAA